MRYKIASLAAAAIMIGGVQVASAADMAVKARPMVAPLVAYNWSGFYVGGEIGYQWNRDKFGDPGRIGGPVGPNTFTWNAFTGGLLAGYNYQMNALVLGVEGDLEWAGRRTGSGTGTLAGNVPFVTGHAALRWQASIRGRLGYAMDTNLFYVTGGVAFGHFDLGFDFPIGAAPTDNFSKTLTGWTVGAGIEHAFTQNWIGRLEYRYTDFGSADGSIIICCAPPPDSQHHELTANTVRAAVSYKFP